MVRYTTQELKISSDEENYSDDEEWIKVGYFLTKASLFVQKVDHLGCKKKRDVHKNMICVILKSFIVH